VSTAVVSGALAAKSGNGGNAWTRLAWTGALSRLGFDVWFVESVPAGIDRAALAWAGAVADAHGLSGRLLFGDAGLDVVGDADLILNISGHLDLTAFGDGGGGRRGSASPVRVFLDDDPGFTQVWAAQGSAGSRLSGHDLYLTFGTNIGSPDCPLPAGDIAWHGVHPPVLLDAWPVLPTPQPDRLTTVASWRGPFGAVEWAGTTYPLKHHEFRALLPLPSLVPAEYDLALDIHPAEVADLAALAQNGWRVTEPSRAAGDPERYRSWVQGSGAEVSAAQGVYTHTNSGWVSDRTAAYLASGRPAVVQDTSPSVPTGEGLLTFRDLSGAADAVRSVLDDYDRHAKAARALAEEHFDAVAIAGRVCEWAGVAP
jgi:hypothetical protein